MDDRCCVLGCLKSSDDGVTLFAFPLNNKSLLPIWIMATHREPEGWTPLVQSRICDEHFNIDDFEDGDKNKMLLPNASPMVTSYDIDEISTISIDSDLIELSSTRDVNFSDIDTDDLPETPVTSDMDFPVNDSVISDKTDSSDTDSSYKRGLSSTETSIENNNDRKRKNNINIENNSKIQKNSTENEECIIESGEKDKKKALFSKIDKPEDYALKRKNADVSIIVENPDRNDNSILWKPLDLNEETIMVPKSKNGGNDHDYIYLESLSGNDIESFVVFEKKTIQKNIKTIIPEPEKKCSTGGISKADIFNDDLIQNYGKMLLAYCDPSCQQACYNSITGPQRSEIYKEFRMLDNEPVRNCKIIQLVKFRTIKCNGKFDTFPVYHLMINKTLVKVCRTFFMNTLGIPEVRLNAVLEPKIYHWFSVKNTALESNRPNQANVIVEPVPMTDFVKESLKMLDEHYKLIDSHLPEPVPMTDFVKESLKMLDEHFKWPPEIKYNFNILKNK